MKYINKAHMPDDADARRAVPPVICYPTDSLPTAGTSILAAARQALEKIDEVLVPPREARCFEVPAGHFFRIVSVEGSQVGDLNLWQADNLDERFYAGKTQGFHGTHLSTGDIYMLVGAFCTSLGYNLSAKLSSEMASWEVITWSLTLTLPLAMIGSLLTWQGMPVASATTPVSMIWAGQIYAGLGSMLLGYILWNMGLAMGGVARIGQLQYLQVFVTLGMAAIVNHDPLRL